LTGDTADRGPETGVGPGSDPLTAERLEKIQDLLLGALEISEDERAGFLSKACGGDEALRREVESLLHAHSVSGPVDRLADTLGARVLTEFIEGRGLEGETIGHYEIRERLRRGGMSLVYRAWDSRLERDVALKFLPVLLSADRTSRERFLVEAQVAAGLEHPNICTIHEIGETEDGRMFIAMPLYEGSTVRAKLDSGPLSEEEALLLALQAARGLARAHASGVIHRDVKPDNLMITHDGTLKVLDFGIAQIEGAARQTGQTPGTALYMSPEQVAGGQIDARTDLWSLGVVLYEMLAGRRPIEGRTFEAVKRAIIEEEVNPLARVQPGVSPATAALVGSLLQKHPSDRIPSAAKLEEEVRRLRRGAAKGTAETRTRRRILVVAGLLGAALLSSVGIWSWGDRLSSGREMADGLEPRSIAVLPFRDLTDDPENEQLVTGLNSVLLTQLHSVADLTPVSTFSLPGDEHDTKSVTEIAGELDVSTVLVGSLQRDGDRALFSARLIDGTTGEQLWADLYQRELTTESLFAIQVDIGQRIADALSLARSADQGVPVDAPPTQNPDAYEYYVRGKALLTDLLSPPGATRDAEWMFRQAVRLDSTFALAWAALAEWHSSAASGVNAPSQSVNRVPTRAGAGQLTADVALDKAVTYGPELPETIKAQGWYLFNVERDQDSALRHFEDVLGMRPTDPDLVGAIGQIRISQGRWDEGLANLERALRLDPGSHWRAVLLGQTYAHLRRYDEAERLYDRVRAAAPSYAEAYINQAIARLKRDGDVRGATRVLEDASRSVDPGELIWRFAQPGAHYPFIRILVDWFHAGLADSAVARHVRSQCEGCFWHLRAQVAEREGEPDVARIYYDSLFHRMVPEAGARPTNYRYAALAAAGLGRIEEASRYQDSSLATALASGRTLSREALSAYHGLESLAEVRVRTGEHEAAMAALEQLLSHPGLLSVQILELDPLWDPLRERSDFQTLLAQYR
jgi:serine/threonine protein kinase/tetratricopeptide (TPR) repeat protein